MAYRHQLHSGLKLRPPAGPLHLLRTLPVLTVIALSLVISGCSFLGIGGKSGASGGARSASVFHLQVGDCVVPPTKIEAEITRLEVVPCREAHTQEVFALIRDKAGTNYPGAPALQTFATASCLQQFQSYVGVTYEDSSLFYTYLLPSVRSWTAEDRTVVCFITTTGRRLTASVRGSRL